MLTIRYQFLMLVVGFFLFTGSPFARAKEKNKKTVEAVSSVNKGRTGRYTCPVTENCPYSYEIVVPENYSVKDPPGLFMYIPHASGYDIRNGQSTDPTSVINRLRKQVFGELNMIALFLTPPGGAPKEPNKKAQTAEYAIAQTLADYHIVAGRGILYATGGGVNALNILYSRSNGIPGPRYPFCTNNLNSGILSMPVPTEARMNWFLNIGEKEYDNDATRWCSQAMERRMAEVLKYLTENGGCPDIYYMVNLGHTHNTGTPINQPCVEAFKRAEAAFAPFLCQSLFNAKGISEAVDLANQHQFAKALKALGPIREEKEEEEDENDTGAQKKKKFIVPGGGGSGARSRGADFNRQAGLIRNAIAKKIREKQEFAQKILKQDTVVGIYYIGQFKKDCAGLRQQGRVFDEMYAAAIKNKENKKRLALFDEFCRLYPDLYDTRTGHIKNEHLEFMKQVRDNFGEESNLGKMVRERLEMTLQNSKEP